MHKLIISIFFFRLAPQLAAQKADLLLIDENIDTSSLEKNFQVKKGSTRKSYLPDKSDRDAFLRLVPESQKWDEYQKDSFYMDLKKKSVGEIKKKYPHLSSERISKLKEKL